MVEVKGPELPILDGSFQPWIDSFSAGGRREQAGEPDRLRLEESVHLRDGDSDYRAVPGDSALLSVTIEWPHPSIGRQSAELELTGDSFRREIARARTFGFAAEIEALQREGLLKGLCRDARSCCPKDRWTRATCAGPTSSPATNWGTLPETSCCWAAGSSPG